jgi:PKHD-type hydroxylase
MFAHKVAEAVDFHIQVVPDKLIDLMVEEVEKMNIETFKNAEVGGDIRGRMDEKIRNSKINWWYEDHWVCSIFSHYIGLSNKKIWEYDLNRLESIQVTTYNTEGHYNWHSDYGTSTNPFFTRKLSASLLVTDPSEYEGGDLYFIDYHGRSVKAPKEKGTMIIFDSRIPHKVSRVTKGKRTSLVTWMYGPKLK